MALLSRTTSGAGSPPTDRPIPVAAEPAGPTPALDDPVPDRRRTAALAAREDPEMVRPVLARLSVEDNLAVRQALFDALVSVGGTDAAAGLLDLLRSEDVHLRNEAITALSEMADDVPAHIDGMLASNDPDVRIFTVNILRDLRHVHTTAWLTRVMKEDDHPNVVGTALDEALELADPSMAAAVETARDRFPDDPYITFVSGLILSRIEGLGR